MKDVIEEGTSKEQHELLGEVELGWGGVGGGGGGGGGIGFVFSTIQTPTMSPLIPKEVSL